MARFDPIASLRPHIRELPPYEALEDLEDLAASYGFDPADVLKLDGNEGARPPTELLDVLRDYPDTRELEADIAALDRICRVSHRPETAETEITGRLLLDGSGEATVSTGIGFLDHMLTALVKHSRFDLELTC